MRCTIPACLVLLLAQPLVAQDEPESKDTAPDAEAVSLLATVYETYREAPTLTDRVTMAMVSPFGPFEQTFVFRFGADGSGSFEAEDMTMTATDGMFYMLSDSIEERYLAMPLEDRHFAQVLSEVLGDGTTEGMPFHLMCRYLDPPEGWYDSLSMGMLMDAVPASMEAITLDDDAPGHRVAFEAAEGTFEVTIDSANLVQGVVVSPTVPEDAPEGFSMSMTITMDPTVADQLDRPIAIDPGDREAVDDPEAFFTSFDVEEPDESLASGTEAPTFTLQQLGGGEVSLADLEGQVVVLDFWATWCGPCRKALPDLQDFHDWVEAEGHPVKVFAVNVWERGSDEAAIIEKVADFWEDNEYTVPVLMTNGGDPFVEEHEGGHGDISSDYGVTAIPTTVIIDPEGIIHVVHVGGSPGMLDMLKRDTAAAGGWDVTESLELDDEIGDME